MLHVITVGSDINKTLYLQETDIIVNGRLSYKYLILPRWVNYFQKIFAVRDYIVQNNLGNEDIICFVDSYDILAFASGDEIIRKFKNYNTRLLIGAESNCYPPKYAASYKIINLDGNIMEHRKIKNGVDGVDDIVGYSNFLFVNSGGYIGYADVILDMFKWKSEQEIMKICSDGGDQSYLHEYFIAYWNYPEKVQLDYNANIFLNLFAVNWHELYFKNGRIINSILQNNPCFIHFHGFAWQAENGTSIIPSFVNKLKISLESNNQDKVITLKDLQQKNKETIKQVSNL